MSQEIFNRFRKAAGRDYTRDEVIDAAAAIILNAVVQACERLPEAEERVDHIADGLKRVLRKERYAADGKRNGLLSVDPALTRWLLSEGALTPKDVGLKE